MDQQATPPIPEQAPRPPRAAFGFRRSLLASSGVHAVLIALAILLGVGPTVEQGRVWISTVMAYEVLESSQDALVADLEPTREPAADTPPEPQLMPVEVESPEPLPPPDLEPELADVMDTGHIWASLSMDPLPPTARPKIEEVSSEPLALAEEPQRAEDSPVAMEPEEAQPILVRSPSPIYPHVSLRLGHEGTVLVRIHVSARGAVLEVDLVESSGFDRLDDAALAAVREWLFRPATEDGVAVRGSLLHKVVFRIDDAASR